MNIKIGPPSEFSDSMKKQIIDLVADGEQVSRENIEYGLDNADQIAVMLDGDKIVSTATIKNPRAAYRTGVFESAGVASDKEWYNKELGYIATDKKYEGNKLCQKLLAELIPLIKNQPLFATTRKPSMAHILAKYGFEKLGNIYKKDLELLARKIRPTMPENTYALIISIQKYNQPHNFKELSFLDNDAREMPMHWRPQVLKEQTSLC